MNDVAAIRKEYRLQSLLESDAEAHPLKQFEKWWQQVKESNVEEPNAMTLATCNNAGKPSARIVLFKGLQEDGFTFYTNYDSRKGKEINENPFVSLVFFWKELERQVRIEGSIKKLSAAQSDAYFASRPEASRIGAWSSPQSQVIPDREVLEKNVINYTKKFQPHKITRPENWGGYLVMPAAIEFWQGRPSRLHDRLQYTMKNNQWKMERLAP